MVRAGPVARALPLALLLMLPAAAGCVLPNARTVEVDVVALSGSLSGFDAVEMRIDRVVLRAVNGSSTTFSLNETVVVTDGAAAVQIAEGTVLFGVHDRIVLLVHEAIATRNERNATTLVLPENGRIRVVVPFQVDEGGPARVVFSLVVRPLSDGRFELRGDPDTSVAS